MNTKESFIADMEKHEWDYSFDELHDMTKAALESELRAANKYLTVEELAYTIVGAFSVEDAEKLFAKIGRALTFRR
jgi:ABC-type Na+ transport system ATPase subunit NatA